MYTIQWKFARYWRSSSLLAYRLYVIFEIIRWIGCNLTITHIIVLKHHKILRNYMFVYFCIALEQFYEYLRSTRIYQNYNIMSSLLPPTLSYSCLYVSNKSCRALKNFSWYSSINSLGGFSIFGTWIGAPTAIEISYLKVNSELIAFMQYLFYYQVLGSQTYSSQRMFPREQSKTLLQKSSTIEKIKFWYMKTWR